MSVKSKYYVTCISSASFVTLEDAKWNLKAAYTRNDAKKYLTHAHEYIYHFIGDRIHSQIKIKVDDHGNISFGRPIKVN